MTEPSIEAFLPTMMEVHAGSGCARGPSARTMDSSKAVQVDVRTSRLLNWAKSLNVDMECVVMNDVNENGG
jgi:hypothetical protein